MRPAAHNLHLARSVQASSVLNPHGGVQDDRRVTPDDPFSSEYRT